MSTASNSGFNNYYPPQGSTTVNRLRIDGRLHSAGDTVFIPALGYNGTILNIFKRELDGVEQCLVRTLPHDYGTSVNYSPLDLRAGVGVSTHIVLDFMSRNIMYNDNVCLRNCPTRIHPSRDHYYLMFDRGNNL